LKSRAFKEGKKALRELAEGGYIERAEPVVLRER